MADFEDVDLSNCDREPIHQLGAIQPFGFLVAFSTDWLVRRVSANAADFLGADARSCWALGSTSCWMPSWCMPCATG